MSISASTFHDFSSGTTTKEKKIEHLQQKKKNHVKIFWQVTEISLTCNILLKYDFGILQKVFADNENLLSSSN